MEIHPTVLALMQKAAPDPATLQAWIEHHEGVDAQTVEDDLERIERDDTLDVIGWDA